jgi:hypothetical protein
MERAINAPPVNIITGMQTKFERNDVTDPVISKMGKSNSIVTVHTPMNVIGEIFFFSCIALRVLIAYNVKRLCDVVAFRVTSA